MNSDLSQDRRAFLKSVSGATALLAAATPVALRSSAEAAPAASRGDSPADNRKTGTYTDGKYGLELDGVKAGSLLDAEGGHAVADVIVEKLGGDHIQRKHIGNVKYEDFAISFGTGMGTLLYEWVKTFLDGKAERKSGSVVFSDYEERELRRQVFTNALITEVAFPALDAASKDAAKMTLKFAPETTRRVAGSGAVDSARDGKPLSKSWTVGNFRLRIGGLDCSRVSKIEAITVKQKFADVSVDREGNATGVPYLEVGNLVISMAEDAADPFYAWFEDFVIKGNNSQDKEPSGSLVFLSSNRAIPIATLDFPHLGIFKLSPDKAEAGADTIKRVKAEMYCEDIRFTYHAGAISG